MSKPTTNLEILMEAFRKNWDLFSNLNLDDPFEENALDTLNKLINQLAKVSYPLCKDEWKRTQGNLRGFKEAMADNITPAFWDDWCNLLGNTNHWKSL